MPRPNWFLAFPVDGAFVANLPAPPPGFRLFHPEDIHLTLVFLGGCGEQAALLAFGALGELLPAARTNPIAISLGEVVPMGGSRKSYSALSALLGRGRADTTACIAGVRDGVTDRASLRRQSRPPKPHVTLGRPMRRASDEHRRAGLAWAAALDLSGVERTLDRVALYTWSENRQKRLFQSVAEHKLGSAL
jgi:2'-5' RNA ligase